MNKNNNLNFESVFYLTDNVLLKISDTKYEISIDINIIKSFLKANNGNIYIDNFIIQYNGSIYMPFYLFSFYESKIYIYNTSFV